MLISVTDTVGYVALTINLYSMSSKSEHRLRIISVLANLIYVGYGIMISAVPIILGCSVAVLLHIYRLYKMKIVTYGENATS